MNQILSRELMTERKAEKGIIPDGNCLKKD